MDQDQHNFTGKTCFIIMPYGNPNRDAPDPNLGLNEREHFNSVYDLIIETLGELKIKPLRSDRTLEATPIHTQMLTEIIDADVAVVDITNGNPNVFYVLGVRHTARRHTTILIGSGETLPPFNLSGVRVTSYDLRSDQSRQTFRQKLRDAIAANLSARVTDSLVHSLLPGLNLSRPQTRLKDDRSVLEIEICPSSPKTERGNGQPSKFKLGIIKGDLVDIDTVDVWVNPESTRMDMARIHDDSVSAFIRYHGARKDAQGNVKRDDIYRALEKRVGNKNVEAGWVVATPPGDLRRMNVKAIFHVAAQHGEPCNGYHTIKRYTSVVANSLETMDVLNDSFFRRWLTIRETRKLRSIIFPLLGTRTRDLDPIEVTEGLVREARKYVCLWPNTEIRSIYFLAYTRRDLELCEAAFQRLDMTLGQPNPG